MSAVELELIAGVDFLPMIISDCHTYLAYDDCEYCKRAGDIGKVENGISKFEDTGGVCRDDVLPAHCRSARSQKVGYQAEDNAGHEKSAKLDERLGVVLDGDDQSYKYPCRNCNAHHDVSIVEQTVHSLCVVGHEACCEAPDQQRDADDDQHEHE